MGRFNIAGWKLASFTEACEKGALVMEALANGPHRFSFRAELPNWEAMQRLAPLLPQATLAGYGWLQIPDAQVLEQPVFRLVTQADVDFGSVRLAITPLPIKLPSRDWDGVYPEMVVVKLTTLHHMPVAGALTPSAEIQARIREVAKRVSRENLGPIKSSNAWWSGPRLAQYYEVEIPLSAAKKLLKQLWLEFRLGEGTASFEIAGTAENVAEMVAAGFNFSDSPTGFWPLRREGRPFVIQPMYGLNATAAELVKAAEMVDSLDDQSIRVSATSKYVSWKSMAGGGSRRMFENALSIWSFGDPWKVSLVFEPDRKLKQREFLPFAKQALEQLGATVEGYQVPRM